MVYPELKFQPFTAHPFVGGIHVTVLGFGTLLRTKECLFVRVMKSKCRTLGQHNLNTTLPSQICWLNEMWEELVCKTQEGLRGLENASALAKWRVANG